MAETPPRATFGPAIFYRDAKAALNWLERAFGFERMMVISDDDGNLLHSEMRFGNGYIMVANEWIDPERLGSTELRSPLSVDAANTQTIQVQVDDVDAHCERARAAGATITMEPETQFYGGRTYRALDLEGHSWSFEQHVRDVTREEAVEATGLKIEGWT